MLEFEWPLIFWCAPLPLIVMALLPKARRDDAAILVPFYNEIASLEQHRTGEGFRKPPSTFPEA